jgi:LysM repeat protein
MIGPMRFSFLVSVLLACALAATVLAAALLVGLFPGGSGGSAQATPRPSGSFEVASVTPVTPSPAATPTPAPPTLSATFDPSVGGTYTVQPGDSLSLIGQRLGVPWQMIADANGIAAPDYVITPGQVLIIPPIATPTGGADFYIVQSGDTITGIAQQFDVDPSTLADFNNIADWNSIAVGDIIYIPSTPDATPLPLESF